MLNCVKVDLVRVDCVLEQGIMDFTETETFEKKLKLVGKVMTDTKIHTRLVS